MAHQPARRIANDAHGNAPALVAVADQHPARVARPVLVTNHPRLKKCDGKLHSGSLARGRSDRRRVTPLMIAITAMAARRKKKQRTFTHGHRQGLDRAAEHFLRECYRRRKPARAKDFARLLNLTPEYVSWLAAKILGGSLHEYLRRKQVAYAAQLLRRTPLSVEEIAARSGFGTRSTMHRWFVEAYGVGPVAFRELKK